MCSVILTGYGAQRTRDEGFVRLTSVRKKKMAGKFVITVSDADNKSHNGLLEKMKKFLHACWRCGNTGIKRWIIFPRNQQILFLSVSSIQRRDYGDIYPPYMAALKTEIDIINQPDQRLGLANPNGCKQGGYPRLYIYTSVYRNLGVDPSWLLDHMDLYYTIKSVTGPSTIPFITSHLSAVDLF